MMLARTPCAVLAALLLITTTVWGQTIFRSVDALGRVTYSDKPPAATAAPERTATGDVAASDSDTAPMPYLLRQAVSAFPVTLYTGPSCGEACIAARALLVNRGVPFNEMTVSTAADVDALQRITGGTALPFLTVGGQHLRGFSEIDWNQYLNAAGYPASSQLPAGFHTAPPTSLAPAPAQPVQPPPAGDAAPTPPQPLGRTPGNPAGIQF